MTAMGGFIGLLIRELLTVGVHFLVPIKKLMLFDETIGLNTAEDISLWSKSIIFIISLCNRPLVIYPEPNPNLP